MRSISSFYIGILIATLAFGPFARATDGTHGTAGPAMLDADTEELYDSQHPDHVLICPNATKTLTGHGTSTISTTDICTTTPAANACPAAGTDSKINVGWLPTSVVSGGTLYAGTGIGLATTATQTSLLLTGTGTATVTATGTGSGTNTKTEWGCAGTQTAYSTKTTTSTQTGATTVTGTCNGTITATITGIGTATASVTGTATDTLGGTSTAIGSGTATGTVTVTKTATATSAGYAIYPYTWTKTWTASGTYMFYAPGDGTTATETGTATSTLIGTGTATGTVTATMTGTYTEITTVTSATIASSPTIINTGTNTSTYVHTHGSESHTDLERIFTIPSTSMRTNGGSSESTKGSMPGLVHVISLADGSTTGAYGSFAVPSDAYGVVPSLIYVAAIWNANSADASNHAVRWEITAHPISEDYELNGVLPNQTVVFTGNVQQHATGFDNTYTVYADESSDPLTWYPVGGRVFDISIRRIGSDANDTYIGTANLVGVRIRYTAVE